MESRNRRLMLSLLVALVVGSANTGCSTSPEREMAGQPGGAVAAETLSPAYEGNPWYTDGRSERWTNPWRTDVSRKPWERQNPWKSGRVGVRPAEASHA